MPDCSTSALLLPVYQRRFAELFLIYKTDSNICFLNVFDRCRGNTWSTCEFHGSNGNGFGDIWWAYKLFYFSSIDDTVTSVPFIGTPWWPIGWT